MSPDPVMPPWLADVVPFTDSDLDRALEHAERPEFVAPEPGTYEADMSGATLLGWVPADDDQAEGIMARLAWNQAKLAELDARKKGYSQRITEWFEKDARPIRRRILRYQEALKAYGVEYRRATRKATLNLPSGVVVTQDQAASVHLPDSVGGMTALVAWAKDLRTFDGATLGYLVHTTEAVLISELRKIVKVVEVPVRVEWHCGLVCGHWIVTACDDFAVGEIVNCLECHIDMAVKEVERFEVLEARVIGPDGEPVPGVVIDPGGIVAQTPKPVPL